MTAVRLAEAKSRAAAAGFSNAIVIGADQVAVLEGIQMGKPLNHSNAVKQLQAAKEWCLSSLIAAVYKGKVT